MASNADISFYPFFKDDGVYQTFELLGLQAQQESTELDKLEFENETIRISCVLESLENNLLLEKEQEIQKLQQQLFTEIQSRQQFQDHVASLANLLANIREQCGSLVGTIATLTQTSDAAKGASLCFGSFNNKEKAQEFCDTLKEISGKVNQSKDLSSLPFLLEEFITFLQASGNRNVETVAEIAISPPEVYVTGKEEPVNTRVSRNTHYRDYSLNNGLACICGSVFSCLRNLKTHIRVRKLGKIFKCTICNLRFTTNHSLKKHTISKHGKRLLERYGCKSCGDTFSSLNDLRVHRTQNHAKVDSRSSKIITLTDNHQRDHKYYETFACTCGITFSGIVTFYRLMKLGKLFKCQHCHNRFATNTSLKMHATERHGVTTSLKNKFGCSVCGATFSSLKQLHGHRTQEHAQIENSNE